MPVPYKLIIQCVTLACCIAVLVIACIWMFKRIPNISVQLNSQEIEVERLENEAGIVRTESEAAE